MKRWQIGIIDYGVGNLFSLMGSLNYMGIESVVTSDPDVLSSADRIILPGVGAFGDAVDKFRASGLEPVLRAEVERGKPLLGICVGMQLLFQRSYEFGVHDGLGYLTGSIYTLADSVAPGIKVPQIGWNALHIVKRNDPMLKYTSEGDYVYFVHSYYAKDCTQSMTAYTEYGTVVPAIVHEGPVYGTQFHPEKSGRVGLQLLKAFSELN